MAEQQRAELRARGGEMQRQLVELRAAHDAAQAELSALSPEFSVDEVDELEFKYAQGKAHLARCERLHGRLPPEPRYE